MNDLLRSALPLAAAAWGRFLDLVRGIASDPTGLWILIGSAVVLGLLIAWWIARTIRRIQAWWFRRLGRRGEVLDRAADVLRRGYDLASLERADGLLRADVEGLAIYRGAGSAYLVVSSQGNDSYVVLDAAAPHRLRGAFRIGINVEKGIDGASETDGLEVTSVPLGPEFPRGMLVVQDGRKRLPEGPQNFKYVSWEDIARALALP